MHRPLHARPPARLLASQPPSLQSASLPSLPCVSTSSASLALFCCGFCCGRWVCSTPRAPWSSLWSCCPSCSALLPHSLARCAARRHAHVYAHAHSHAHTHSHTHAHSHAHAHARWISSCRRAWVSSRPGMRGWRLRWMRPPSPSRSPAMAMVSLSRCVYIAIRARAPLAALLGTGQPVLL